jgi:RNA polymerase sigma-70 factor (ECF subfamily)
MLNAAAEPLPLPQDDERFLIARAVKGDRQAARALYDRHATRVYRLAFRLAGDADLAADLTQDVFVRAFRELGKFRGESAFGTWLHRVAVTTCLNGLRKVKRLRTREVTLELAEGEAHEAAAVSPEVQEAVAAAIEALPESLRIVLVMYSLEGYSHAEIAGALGIAEGTSRSRVFEARAQLKTRLAKHLEDRTNG